jgi:hypothetical protein
MSKKILLFLTAMFLSKAITFAQGGTTGPLTWNISSNILTISGNGAMPDYGYEGAPWCEHWIRFDIVVMEIGVTSIGSCAFFDCLRFSSITIPNSVTIIGNRAFDGCQSLTSIIIPNSVTSIGTHAFYNCSSLTSVIISNSATSIGEWAFGGCQSLPSINIPNSVTNIGTSVFAACKSLTSIDVESGNITYASENGVLFDKSKTILICYPGGKAGNYVVPTNVVSIRSTAFLFCDAITSITITDNVINIGDNAFNGCWRLKSINIPNNIKKIDFATFYYCMSLTSVTIPKSVTAFEDYAFSYCTSLTTITNLNPVPVAINPIVFGGVNQSTCTLEVPIASVSAYQNAEVWKEFNIVGIVGIENIEATTIKIYPNPTKGELKSESGELRVKNLVIYDVFGKIRKIENWKTENTIDISHLPAGVYFVKISTEAGEVTKKVLKE